ncbi:MAG TPA: ABC transporter permease [Pyrinomonadaceae bacterium]|nr:ABC transporter permease [Pyrinomonadaceae bacterium]
MARWTAGAAVVGIACGVAALIVATALANGFRDELQDKILRGTAHVTLAREGGEGIADAWGLAERVRRMEGVADAQPTTYEGALVGGREGTNYALLRGLDRQSARALAAVRGTVTKGSLDALFQEASGEDDPVPAVLGEELAARTGLTEIGDEGFILTAAAVSPDAQAGRGGARRVRVVGLFRSGLYEYDSAWAYLSTASVARALGARPNIVLSVEAQDLYASDRLARRLREELAGGWTTVDWREANRPLFEALALERRVVALIIMLVTVVAALNITTTLALVVVERRADIAVLSTVGARAPSVTLVFMIEGAVIGAAGALAGVALGLSTCYLAERFRLVRLPPDVYSLSAVPLHPHASDVLTAALAAFAVSLLATLYPAWQAARVRPAEVLRHE